MSRCQQKQWNQHYTDDWAINRTVHIPMKDRKMYQLKNEVREKISKTCWVSLMHNCVRKDLRTHCMSKEQYLFEHAKLYACKQRVWGANPTLTLFLNPKYSTKHM